ncbi:homocysteine biosynthesis protein [bacterium]|nr:homocysteine biosynthesis protein [bacterium]
MAKTIAEINQKIKSGQVVVVTAEEIIDIVEKKGVEKAAKEVDVVTCATFGPMCSSGAYFNICSGKPKIKLGGGNALLNDVPVYCGFAAGDIYLGATALPGEDPRNKVYPGEFKYGGGHVIEELISGEDVKLIANAYGTDCYSRKKLEIRVNINDFNEAVLFNMRNAYQNYNCAVNLSDRIIYTYMGVLKPNLSNANYCNAGQLSPLLNDPYYETLGVGTRIFLGGGVGYISWHGTQHNPKVKRAENGVPLSPAGTISVIGDLKQMKREFLVGISLLGYGASLSVGIGIPIPVLNEKICKYVAVRDKDIWTQIVDYSDSTGPGIIGKVNYAQLKSGEIEINGKKVPTGSMSSYSKAIEIADILKNWIKKGEFFLTDPVTSLPGFQTDYKFKPLIERPL